MLPCPEKLKRKFRSFSRSGSRGVHEGGPAALLQTTFVYALPLSDADDHVVSLSLTLSRKTNTASTLPGPHSGTGSAA